MIQDIEPKKLINAYDPGAAPDDNSIILFIRDGSAAVTCAADPDGTEEILALPRYAACRSDADYIYLFSVDEDRYFLAPWNEDPPDSCRFVSIRSLRRSGFGPRSSIFAVFTALQLANWYHDNTFCGTCGTRTVRDSAERAVRCPSCGRVIYPRIIPAVIVGVLDGDRILLTKYERSRGVSYYALVAGFTEIGETFEQTVEREVMEEVGLRVKNIRYYKSQPWGIADDILAGFYCDVDGSTEIHLDRTELREGVWVRRGEVIGQPDDFSLTNEMMMRFNSGLENTPVLR